MVIATIVLIIYGAVIVWLGVYAARQVERVRLEEVAESAEGYQQLVDKKTKIDSTVNRLEAEASNVFTLYELTKEVSRNLQEEEAYHIFTQKLRENITFEECLMVDSTSEEVRRLKATREYYIIVLKNKRQKLGVLAVKGLSGEDKEKLVILSHQFSLALRRIKLYEELEQLAITDSLTDVHTRRHLLERFEEELERSESRKIKLALLMIDADHFKRCNDEHGHLTGDKVLRKIGEVIKENIREIDIAGRYGGEEFCVVLPDTDCDGAQYVAERIRVHLEGLDIKAYDATVSITISIGIATYPKDGNNTADLIESADAALYEAKRSGRNKICIFSGSKK